jgi:hypothetical protein
MNIYIDFDHTISPNGYSYLPQNLDKPPYDGAIDTIRALKAGNDKIIIFSCRANKDVVGDDVVTLKTKEMTDYLNKHGIPFDSVFLGKPNYDVVIDDKAIGFHDNWEEINKLLVRRI